MENEIQTRNLGKIQMTAYDRSGKAYPILASDVKTLGLLGIKKLAKKKWRNLDPDFFLMLAGMINSNSSEKWKIKNKMYAKLFFRADIQYWEIKLYDKKITFSHDYLLGFLLNQVLINNQYDISKDNIQGKIIIDVGANIGDFALTCAALGAKKVYAFEPISDIYAKLQNNITNSKFDKTIIPINMALGSTNGNVTLKYGGPSNQIKICKLDEFLHGEKVDFIKMDVEGYEEDVLLGATNTIKKYKPILSFSAYHKPSDKTRLPDVVHSIRPDYHIKLNKFDEEDFYCH